MVRISIVWRLQLDNRIGTRTGPIRSSHRRANGSTDVRMDHALKTIDIITPLYTIAMVASVPMSAQVCIDVVAAAARRAAMPKRKADECISNTRGKASTRVSLDDERRKKLRAELVASTGATKSGIAKVLQTLQGEGLLKDDKLGAPKERDRLTEASAHHARADTPYGKVVQRVAIPMTTGPPLAWEFINPFAFIWYLSTICCGFSEMMANAARDAGHKLRFLL